MDSIPAVVHLDLDGAPHIYRAHGWRYPLAEDPLFETGLRGALATFAEAGIGATLFVVAEDLRDPRKRALLREAVRCGHDIASHSLTHRNLTLLRPDEKRTEIRESRERLRQDLAQEVAGFRAPGFAIDRESLELIAEAGYAYDSSLFPTAEVAHRLGIEALSATPGRFDPRSPLCEVPLPAYAPLPFPFHPCYSLMLGLWYFRFGLARFRRTRAPLALLFHLTDFADPLPSAALPNPWARLFTLSHLGGEAKRRRCRRMLDIVARDYRWTRTNHLVSG